MQWEMWGVGLRREGARRGAKMATAILFGLGLGIGTLGTLIGAGGGWMIVPIHGKD
jgi:uncharacterized membrane protein YfcA